MALEDQTWKIGGVTFPLTSSTSNSLLVDGDPCAHYLAAYLASCLTTHLGGRWTAETTAASRTDIGTLVAATVPYDPSPYLAAAQWKFPLLAVYRSEETFEEEGPAADVATTEWKVEFVLPALRPADVERLAPVLRLVAAVCRQRLQRGQDDGYSATSFRDLAGIASATLTRAEYGAYEAAGDLVFPVVRMTVAALEKEAAVTGAYDAMSGLQDAHVDMGDLTDVVVVRIDTQRAFSAAFSTGYA